MKKFLTSIVLGAGIVFGSLFATIPMASAQDVYIKTSVDGRYNIYVVTESIDTNGVDYVNVTVKYVKDSKLVHTNHVNYVKKNGNTWQVSSVEGRKGGARATNIYNPAEDKILWYCLHYRR